MNEFKVGFIGLGLIGGSLAKVIREKYPQSTITAFDVNHVNLNLALKQGIINSATEAINQDFENCSIIFLCTPIENNNSYLKEIKKYILPDTILTDVGSVKMPIHKQITLLDMETNFIGGHPMAGSEKSGFENASSLLFENAYFVLTPTDKVPITLIKKYEEFICNINAIPVILEYNEHDKITAAISHLPHLIASSLVNLIKEKDSNTQVMKMMAAGGFKDITRIASAAPDVWQQICLNNKEQISLILNDYIASLIHIKKELDTVQESSIYNFFSMAREYRNSIPNASLGPIQKIFSINCELIDEAGGIAAIATILASNRINIKNIGIIHSREFEEGVLRIEFYKETALLKAITLLRKYHYTVYERK